MDDHYEALGLEPEATPEQIKKAFKALALQYHPDQHPSPIASAIFRRIHEAYQVLSDPQQRKRYDERRLSARPRRQPRSKPAPGPEPPPPKSEGRRREAAYREQYARRRARQARAISDEARRENEERLREILDDDQD